MNLFFLPAALVWLGCAGWWASGKPINRVFAVLAAVCSAAPMIDSLFRG